MTYIGADADETKRMVAEGVLKLSDLGLFHVLLTSMSPSGRVNLRPKVLAERLGISSSACYQAIKRLQTANCLVRVLDEDTGGTFFLLNPFLASTGSPKTRAALWAQFKAALESPEVE